MRFDNQMMLSYRLVHSVLPLINVGYEWYVAEQSDLLEETWP